MPDEPEPGTHTTTVVLSGEPTEAAEAQNDLVDHLDAFVEQHPEVDVEIR